MTRRAPSDESGVPYGIGFWDAAAAGLIVQCIQAGPAPGHRNHVALAINAAAVPRWHLHVWTGRRRNVRKELRAADEATHLNGEPHDVELTR